MANEQQPETGIPPAAPAPAAPEETAITLPRGPGAATDAAQSVPMTPTDEEMPAWLNKADWLLLGLLVVLSFLLGASPALNPDLWMQLGTGRLIAHGEYFPGGAEPFSVATEARDGHEAVPWVNHSWLFALGLYLLYSVTGTVGLAIFKAILVAALAVVLIQVRSRDTNLLVLAICLTVSMLALATTRLFLQPVLVSYLLLGVTLLVLHRAGVFATGSVADAEAAPHQERWLWALPALCVLWVNVDNWFVLGPLTVGLCWAGLAIERWRGLTVRVAPSKFGLVFGACLLACLANPAHVRAFQLPPELAYLVVRAADSAGLELPDALVGGGRTLAIWQDFVHESGQTDRLTLSPLADGYLGNASVGYNVSGVCFFPLLILGLVSFTLNGFVAGKPGAPAPQAARFLVWLAFAVFATLLYRTIPYFAIVAGPIAALNLSELLAWYTTPTAAGEPPMPWVAPARLIRLLGVPLLVALGLLAWPGWLNGPRDLESPQHVAWDIPIDTSLQKAAERLAELQSAQSGRGPASGVRLMSTGMEMNAYCAWFAPGVKGFFDTRFNLFPNAIKDYLKARLALADKSRPVSDWSTVMRAYRMDHVVAEKFLTPPKIQFIGFWADPARWRQEFADRDVAVFAWSGPTGRWPTDLVLEEWNTLAFGPVPPERRPPARGPAVPPENRSLLDRYLQPPPHIPQAAMDVDAKGLYSAVVMPKALDTAKRTLLISTYALASLPLAPGACNGPYALGLSGGMVLAAGAMPPAQLRPELRKTLAHGFWVETDFQPPAVPVLVMRQSWQAVAESPDSERGYVILANAIARASQQEKYWVIGLRDTQPPNTLRSMLRNVQLVSALQSAAEVGFSDPRRQHQVHFDLYSLYLEKHALDLALDQVRVAEQAWDSAQPEDARQQEDWRAWRKELEGRRKGLEDEVKRRQSDFDLKTATRSKKEKLTELLYGTITRFTKENKPVSDPRGWGLTGMALQMLQDIDPESLKDNQQKLSHAQLLIDLLFQLGQARQASILLDSVQDALGAAALNLAVYRAGTQGNYDELRATLAKLERPRAEIVRAGRAVSFAYNAALVLPPPFLSQAHAMLAVTATRATTWAQILFEWSVQAGEHYNLMTLRGIIALEAGDTAAAQRHFEQALNESAGFLFSERAIAQRYATMLAAYQKR
jgi:hypothetical protein